MKKQTNLFTAQASVFFICLLCAVFSCNLPEYEYRKVCHVVVAKHERQEWESGTFGAFYNAYYFLYDDGEVRGVSLHDYMKYPVGTTLCWDVRYRTK